VVKRQRAETSRNTLSWPALTVGALLAGILAIGVGRVFSFLFPGDSEAALVTHIAVAVIIACGAGLTLGTSDLLLDRWRKLRRR
jgi:Mg/Co/Ni transporter MgtE